MVKRIAALLMALTMLATFGCANDKINNNDQPAQAQVDELGQLAENSVSAADNEEKFPILGLIINDDGSDKARLTMFGFLRTAETLCYASKIFRAKPGAEAEAAVDAANAEGIAALMIFDPDGQNTAAVEKAAALGMKIVMPYYACSVSGITANVIADNEEYYDELARGLAARLEERSLKSGRILVYGSNISQAYAAINSSIMQNYPQYIVCSFERTAADEEGAIAELADFILNNRDIKGIYAAQADAAAIAVSARSLAQKRFKNEGAPTPTPAAEAEAAATPAPAATADSGYTPNPALLTQIMITVFACGLNADNYALFEDNDIYALCIEPYYEAAAQSTMIMDRIIRAESIADTAKVNRPIVYSDTVEKYSGIYNAMLSAFETGGE